MNCSRVSVSGSRGTRGINSASISSFSRALQQCNQISALCGSLAPIWSHCPALQVKNSIPSASQQHRSLRLVMFTIHQGKGRERGRKLDAICSNAVALPCCSRICLIPPFLPPPFSLIHFAAAAFISPSIRKQSRQCGQTGSIHLDIEAPKGTRFWLHRRTGRQSLSLTGPNRAAMFAFRRIEI